ncbi:MAG: hypothetical protein ABIH72_04290, partial [archaeon]
DATNLAVGKSGSLSAAFFNGSIDEVRIYNRSLSSLEVYQHYSSNLKKLNSTHWEFYSNQSDLREENQNYTYQACASDIYGYLNCTGLRTVMLTSIAPNGTLLTPANQTVTNITSQNFTLTITDNIGIKNATLYIYNSTNDLVYNYTFTFARGVTTATLGSVYTLTEGVYTWFYKVWDWADNLFTSEVREITIDTSKPGLYIIYPLNITYNHNITELNYTTTDLTPDSCWYTNETGSLSAFNLGGVNFTGVNNSREGSNTWTLYCNDSVGNVNSTSVSFVIDTIPPYVAWVTPENGTRYNQTNIIINLNFSSDVSYVGWYNGSSNLTYTVPVSINLATNNYTFYAYANDSAGNINFSRVDFEVTLDETPPLIIIQHPLPTTYSIFTLDLNVSSTETNPDTWWYTLDNGNTNTSFIPNTTITASAGNNLLIVYLNDTSGNTGFASVSFTILTASPLLSIIFPENLAYNHNITSLNYSVSDTDLDSCWYSITGLVNISIFCGANITGLQALQGWNTWSVYANDSVSSLSSASVNFYVDSLPPEISLINPLFNSEQSSSAITFSFNATDLSSIENCTLIIDSSPRDTTSSVPNGLVSSIIYSLSEGTYSWQISCTDQLLNIGYSPVWIFNLTFPQQAEEYSGGGGGCYSRWECTNWSLCKNALQSRNCTDLRNCNKDYIENRSCITLKPVELPKGLDCQPYTCNLTSHNYCDENGSWTSPANYCISCPEDSICIGHCGNKKCEWNQNEYFITCFKDCWYQLVIALIILIILLFLAIYYIYKKRKENRYLVIIIPLIKKALSEGKTKEEIKKQLLEKHWPLKIINKAFRIIEKEKLRKLKQNQRVESKIKPMLKQESIKPSVEHFIPQQVLQKLQKPEIEYRIVKLGDGRTVIRIIQTKPFKRKFKSEFEEKAFSLLKLEVREALFKGHSHQEIISRAKSKHWPLAIINDVFSDLEFEEIQIKAALNHKIIPSKIPQTIIKADKHEKQKIKKINEIKSKFKSEFEEKAFSLLKMEIRELFNKGYSKQQIKEKMLFKNWPESLIDQVFLVLCK